MTSALKHLLDEVAAIRQRGIPPITESQLEGLLGQAEQLARENLTAQRSLEPFARLVIPLPEGGPDAAPGELQPLPGGQLGMLHFPLPLPDNAHGKAEMFARLKVTCKALAAMAVIVMTDAWVLYDEKAGRPGTSKEGYRFVIQHGSVAAAKAGFGTLTEVIAASAQTKDLMVIKNIPYERRFRGGVLSPSGQSPLNVPHTINVLDKPWVVRCPQDHAPSQSNMVLIYEGPLNEA